MTHDLLKEAEDCREAAHSHMVNLYNAPKAPRHQLYLTCAQLVYLVFGLAGAIKRSVQADLPVQTYTPAATSRGFFEISEAELTYLRKVDELAKAVCEAQGADVVRAINRLDSFIGGRPAGDSARP
jgi:hypothetical protein